MCSMYWNLDTKVKCPKCGKTSSWNLQTHFMGDIGSHEHNYKLGEKIKELGGKTVTMDGIDNRRFISDCSHCDNDFYLGAEITDGIVNKIFFLKNLPPLTSAHI